MLGGPGAHPSAVCGRARVAVARAVVGGVAPAHSACHAAIAGLRQPTQPVHPRAGGDGLAGCHAAGVCGGKVGDFGGMKLVRFRPPAPVGYV